MSVEVVTFGCRLNAAESEVIRREAERAGLSDTVVVNTCAVTAEAVRQARQTIRALRRERPQAKIVVTGCAAQTEPQTFAAMAGGRSRPRQREKLSAAGLGARPAAAFGLDDAPKALRQRHHGGHAKPRAHLIEASTAARAPSCRCRTAATTAARSASFPFGRGNSRSVPMGAVVDEVRRLVANGYSRGRAHRRRHHELRRRSAGRAEARHAGQADPQARAGAQAAAPVLDRLGRGRSRPASTPSRDEAAADAASASVAAGRRRSDPQAHEAPAFARATRSRSATTCAGCARTWCSAPISSPASRPRPRRCSQRSLDLVDECGLTHLHVFPFSPRPGTPAARMPQVARAVVKERARRLRERGAAALRRASRCRSRARGGACWPNRDERGRTEQFTASSRLRAPAGARRDRGPVRIAGHDGQAFLMRA